MSVLDAVPQDVTMLVEAESPKAVLEAIGPHVVTVGAFGDFAQTVQLMDSMFGKDAKVGEVIRDAQMALLLSPQGEQNAHAVVYLLNKSLSSNNLGYIIESNELIYEKREYEKKVYFLVPDWFRVVQWLVVQCFSAQSTLPIYIYLLFFDDLLC